MYSTEIRVSGTNENEFMSLGLFLESPDSFLESESNHLWFTTSETHSILDFAVNQVTPEDTVLQFCSHDALYDLLSVSPPLLRAALGLTGVTAIKAEHVKQALTATQPKSEIELLLAVAQQTTHWRVVKNPGSTFSLRSPIPASSEPNPHPQLSAFKSFPVSELFPDSANSTTAAEILAGILLIHDFLEPSHEYSQSIEGMSPDANGDYWHGIMHRREPDFGNAKYWFRRVGNHPCFQRLAETAHQLAQQYQDKEIKQAVQSMTETGWDSFAAVEFFQEAHSPARRGSDWHAFAEELQMCEMLILLAHCCQPTR